MPPGTRIRDNNVFGTTTDNPLTIGAVVMNSTELSLLSAVVAGNHAIITLDPLRINGAPEIIVITAHGVGASSASITRGAYGTVARAHPLGTQWVHAPVTEDVTKIVTSGTRPTDPYRGQKIFETDTNRYIGRTTADTWQQEGLFFDPPAASILRTTDQTLTSGVGANLQFDSEIFDTDNMANLGVNNDRLTVVTPGIYIITGFLFWKTSATGVRRMDITIDGSAVGGSAIGPNNAGDNFSCSGSAIVKLTVGQVIRMFALQTSGGNLNTFGNLTFLSAAWIGRGN